MSAITKDDLIDFVYEEVHLLDSCQYDAWIALWAEDGKYWMPLEPGQTDYETTTSMLFEDLFMLKLRIERFHGQRTFSQKPRSRCHHVLQRPRVVEMDDAAGKYVVEANFHYVETRLDEQFLLAVFGRWELEKQDDGLKMTMKRVELLNPDAAFGNIQLLP